MNRYFFTISKLDVKYDLKVQVLKDACRAVIQFMFTQVEHHFGNDLKHPDHQDDHSQYDEEHCLDISLLQSTFCSPSALVRLALAAWLLATLLLVRSLSRYFHLHHDWLGPGLN